MSARQIGSVEVLRLRVYPDLDDPTQPDVTVPAGSIFPLLRSGDRVWWPMRGRLSTRHDATTERLGDGMFMLTAAHDELSDETRSITSRTFSPDELCDTLDEPGMAERLRVTLFEPLGRRPANRERGTVSR